MLFSCRKVKLKAFKMLYLKKKRGGLKFQFPYKLDVLKTFSFTNILVLQLYKIRQK